MHGKLDEHTCVHGKLDEHTCVHGKLDERTCMHGKLDERKLGTLGTFCTITDIRVPHTGHIGRGMGAPINKCMC